MNKANTWILAITLAAFGVGVILFYSFPLRDDRPASLESVTTLPGNADNGENQLIFPYYENPTTLPELNFVDIENRNLNIDSFRGKMILLNIWATWCIPCREEMPTLDRLQEKLGGPDFEVVALSIDRGEISIVEDFYTEFGLKNLAIYQDSTGGAPFKINVLGIPATLLINREGKELGRVVGPAEWDSPAIVREIRSFLPPA